MAKILVLIRHAHRDVNFHADNNSLSEKGRLQADRLARFFSDRFGENSERVTLISSPKQRCQETLLPIARRINQDVLVDPLLDEEGAAPPRLDVRVGQFLENWRRGHAGLTLACSHGDWLPIAIHRLLGLHVEPLKASWIEVEDQLGSILLRWMVPTLKNLYK